MNFDIEEITPEEFQLRKERDALIESLKKKRELKKVWVDSPDGGKAISSKRGRIKTLDKHLKKSSITAAEKRAKKAQKKKLSNELDLLVKKRNKSSSEIKAMESSLKEKKAELISYSKGRRGAEGSIYTMVDRIF